MHDTVKHANAKFGWGTRSGKELLELNEKLVLREEISFWEEVKKHSLAGKIGSALLKNLNDRLAIFRWRKTAKKIFCKIKIFFRKFYKKNCFSNIHRMKNDFSPEHIFTKN